MTLARPLTADEEHRLRGMHPNTSTAMGRVLAALREARALDAVLASLSDDDVMYDHPTAPSGEPMDPVLFVRWAALAIEAEARALPSTPTDQRLADCEDALATVEAAYDRDVPASTPTDREAALREAAQAVLDDMDSLINDPAVMLPEGSVSDAFALRAALAATPAEVQRPLGPEPEGATLAEPAEPGTRVLRARRHDLSRLGHSRIRRGEPAEPAGLCARCGHGHTEAAWSDKDPDDGTCWNAGTLVCGCPKFITSEVASYRAARLGEPR